MKKKTLFQVGLITLVCVGTYFALRSLPDTRCEFLHYEATSVTDNGIEFCETSPASFLDLERLIFPVNMQLTLDSEPQVGQKSLVKLALSTQGGSPILPHELAITHTERLHLLVVDPSLRDYHHIHPEALGPNGEWTFAFKPRLAGVYQLYAEMVPVRTRRKAIATGAIKVPGIPQSPEVTRRLESSVADYHFTLEVEPEHPQIWQDNGITLRVNKPGGGDVVLQEIMGAYAHMVAFDNERSGFAHMHPTVTGKENSPQPEVGFIFNTSKPGHYRIWAQVKLEDRTVFAPFDLEVKGES